MSSARSVDPIFTVFDTEICWPRSAGETKCAIFSHQSLSGSRAMDLTLLAPAIGQDKKF